MPETYQLSKLWNIHPGENGSCAEFADVGHSRLVLRRNCHDDRGEGSVGDADSVNGPYVRGAQVYILKNTSIPASKKCRSTSVRVTACMWVEGFMSEGYSEHRQRLIRTSPFKNLTASSYRLIGTDRGAQKVSEALSRQMVRTRGCTVTEGRWRGSKACSCQIYYKQGKLPRARSRASGTVH